MLSKRSSIEVSDRIFERPDSLNVDFDDISGFHEYLRVSPEPHASRRACRDDITDFQRHHLRNIGDEIRNLEDEIPRVRLLHRFPIQPQLNVESVTVAQTVPADEERSNRSECVERLGAEPLAVGKLEIAR